KFDRRIAKATADIEDLVTLLDGQRWEDCLTVMGQPVDQDVLVLDKFRNKYLVPEIHVLGALHVFGDCIHDFSPRLVRLGFLDAGLPTGSPAMRHSGNPSSSRRALKPRARSAATASYERTQYGPRQ